MVTFYRQEKPWSCGAASMRMVLECCGIRMSEKQVIRLLGTNKVRGTWAGRYAIIAEKYALNYVVLRNTTIGEMRGLMKKHYHILTSYYVPREKVDHFVVVKRIGDEHIHFYDPYYGPDHKYKISYFKKVWRTDPRYDNERAWLIGIKK